ncbi:MAG: hypothetical protein J5U19_07420 [Candidatus Methanoperedens sp.]|nr:hypothetical protein [Candidatus Methanoperedens sp.]
MPDNEILFDIGGMLFLLTVLILLVKTSGTYLTNVYQGKHTFLSPALSTLAVILGSLFGFLLRDILGQINLLFLMLLLL